MSSYFKFPFINPFKMVPNTTTPGIHFDDDWACKQISNWERRVLYKQKWKRSDTTKLQMESTIAPQNLKVLNADKQVVKQFAWTAAFANVNYSIYETTFDISDIPEGMYFLYQFVGLANISWSILSEPIDSRDVWQNTLLIKYKHRFNDYGVAFSTGVEFAFRVEAAIKEYQPERDRVAYINQTNDIKTLSASPWRSFKFLVGEAPGVAPWVPDLLNWIFACSYVNIENKLYQSTQGSKWEINRARGYPLVGASLEIQPSYNNTGLEFATGVGVFPQGIVTAYNMDTGFFGPGTIVPITDIEHQA